MEHKGEDGADGQDVANGTSRAHAPELVILVHGTFAGDRDRRDKGDRWWQRGGDTWNWLAENLPDGVQLPDGDVKLFHWSGRNSQADRLQAAADLLDRLLALERQGRNYHLVGHSHGGSVIWEAMITAQLQCRRAADKRERRFQHSVANGDHLPTSALISAEHENAELNRQTEERASLPGLRTWTTVGTPFLHHMPRGKLGWPNPRFSLSEKEKPFPWEGLKRGLFVLLPLTVALAAASEVEHSPRYIIPLMIVMFPFLYGLSSWIMDAVGYRSALWDRARYARRAFAAYGDRWLGLWAPEDEAIALLQGLAVRHAPDYMWLCTPAAQRKPFSGGSVMPGEPLPSPPFKLELKRPRAGINLTPVVKVGRIRRGVVLPFYGILNNRILPPMARWAWQWMMRNAQGNDLPNTVLAYASTWPLPLREIGPGLPESSTRLLETSVNRNIEVLIPGARRLLAQAALDGSSALQVIGDIQLPVGTNALLHTSYFDHPDVLELIRLHITRNRQYPGEASGTESTEASSDLGLWLDANRIAVRHTLKMVEALE
ncbi:hypothetical protein [Streptomyces nigrescens]|uniref:hypothetical protein n=1 Tax=Streptomyces nigrescens TaxID=1920 RepID=UPI0036FFA1FA